MTTPLDALIAALHEAASYNASAEAAPVAVVWCDAGKDFSPLIPALRERLPELLAFGDFEPEARTGPAVWIRAATVGAVEGVGWPEGTTPIIYMPGVARETLKGAEDCPQLLQPLVWYIVAGSYFGHVNGKDWTLRGFLSAERGPLKLEMPDDSATRAALSHAAVRLCTRSIDELRGKRWDADLLNALLAPDLTADMLDWIDGSLSDEVDAARFNAFASIAKKELKFDPSKLSKQDAVKRLAKREGQVGASLGAFRRVDRVCSSGRTTWASKNPPRSLTILATERSTQSLTRRERRNLETRSKAYPNSRLMRPAQRYRFLRKNTPGDAVQSGRVVERHH